MRSNCSPRQKRPSQTYVSYTKTYHGGVKKIWEHPIGAPNPERVIQDVNKTFEETITASTQLSVSTNNSLTGDNAIDLNDNTLIIDNIVNDIETDADEI